MTDKQKKAEIFFASLANFLVMSAQDRLHVINYFCHVCGETIQECTCKVAK